VNEKVSIFFARNHFLLGSLKDNFQASVNINHPLLHNSETLD
jgi:hypothetical protein